MIRSLVAKASPLHGQCKGEPDGRCVEHGGDDFVHDVPSVAGAYRREWLVVVAERIHVEEPRRREEQGEHVGEGHCHEHGVGGSAHVPLGQHHHDQCVGDDGDHQQEGHHITVHGLCVADGQLARHIQEQNARVVAERFVTLPRVGAVARHLVRHSLHHHLQANSNVQRKLLVTVHREKQSKRHSLRGFIEGCSQHHDKLVSKMTIERNVFMTMIEYKICI